MFRFVLYHQATQIAIEILPQTHFLLKKSLFMKLYYTNDFLGLSPTLDRSEPGNPGLTKQSIRS